MLPLHAPDVAHEALRGAPGGSTSPAMGAAGAPSVLASRATSAVHGRCSGTLSRTCGSVCRALASRTRSGRSCWRSLRGARESTPEAVAVMWVRASCGRAAS